MFIACYAVIRKGMYGIQIKVNSHVHCDIIIVVEVDILHGPT